MIKKISIELSRQDSKVSVKIKIPQEIDRYFRKLNGGFLFTQLSLTRGQK